MKQTVKFATLETTPVYHRPEGYKVLTKPKGSRLRGWVAVRLWRLLHRIGALKEYETFSHNEYEWGQLQEKEVFDRIREMCHVLGRDGNDPRDYALLVGAKDFHELTGAALNGHFNNPMMEVEFRIQRAPDHMRRDLADHGYRSEIIGLPAHVVPNMEGCVLVPKVAVERLARGS